MCRSGPVFRAALIGNRTIESRPTDSWPVDDNSVDGSPADRNSIGLSCSVYNACIDFATELDGSGGLTPFGKLQLSAYATVGLHNATAVSSPLLSKTKERSPH